MTYYDREITDNGAEIIIYFTYMKISQVGNAH
jgi:hypothetical protein